MGLDRHERGRDETAVGMLGKSIVLLGRAPRPALLTAAPTLVQAMQNTVETIVADCVVIAGRRVSGVAPSPTQSKSIGGGGVDRL